MVLFVDDLAGRRDNFVATFPDKPFAWADTVDAACNLLLMMEFDEVWLDHDAGELMWSAKQSRAVTFYPVACMLAAMKFKGKVYLHTMNDIGAQRMMALLKEHSAEVIRPSGYTLAGIWGGKEPGAGGGYCE